MTTIHSVVGGQYGSEAKGHVCAQLSKRYQTIGVRVGGPNAGHTVVDDETGVHWAFRHLPVAAIADPTAPLFLAAGSEVDPDVLRHEVEQVEQVGISVRDRLFVDQNATWLEKRHIEEETASALDNTGSTKKGIGAARADRIWRKARTIGECGNVPGVVCDTQGLISDLAEMQGRDIVIEGTQGYGLGVHTSNYPHSTSGDCRAIDTLAQAGLIPGVHGDLAIWLVFRTYPIRIAGNSGEMNGELTWDELEQSSGGYIKPERTTVTKKIRRVAHWDSLLAKEACEANGGQGEHLRPCLMFLDYLQPDLAGVSRWEELTAKMTEETIDTLSKIESDIGHVAMFGTSANTVVWSRNA